jgi:hypothetical protein
MVRHPWSLLASGLAGLASLVLVASATPSRSQEDKKDAKEAADKPIVITGELKSDDPKDLKLKASPAKVHKVKLNKGVTYVIDLKSKDFDAFLRLEDPTGNPVAEDDDSGGMLNARLFFIPPETADYAVIATCYKPKTGKYTLSVQRSKLQAAALDVDKDGTTVQGKLTITGPKSPFSPHNNCQLYRVELKAGTRYVIDLESTDFDAYLTLADARLAKLASDDDGGGKRNARIRFECKQDGVYYIAATGLGEPEGAFTLKIRPDEKSDK